MEHTGKSLREYCFNSKMVRLKVSADEAKDTLALSFNSKMVRLKGKEEFIEAVYNLSFNSKMVRLKATGTKTAFVSETMFQFQNGTIKSVSRLALITATSVVSIPKWYD